MTASESNQALLSLFFGCSRQASILPAKAAAGMLHSKVLCNSYMPARPNGFGTAQQ